MEIRANPIINVLLFVGIITCIILGKWAEVLVLTVLYMLVGE